MAKSNKSKNRQKRKGKGSRATAARARKINASTPYDVHSAPQNRESGTI